MRRRVRVLALIVVIFLIIVFWIVFKNPDSPLKSGLETYDNINNQLVTDGVKLHLTEDQIVALLGEGEYQEGFGGHFRMYASKALSIGFAGDPDNDFYGLVGQIEFSNPNYSLYGIKAGDPVKESAELLSLRTISILRRIFTRTGNTPFSFMEPNVSNPSRFGLTIRI
jgi:hypothetical protein